MGGRGASSGRAGGLESWRSENPKFQEKTAGGVYFYDSPSTFGDVIERRIYDKLPKYAKESVVQLNSTDVSISGWFKIDSGIAYLNTTKSDFIPELRGKKSLLRNANGYRGNVDKDTTESWEY